MSRITLRSIVVTGLSLLMMSTGVPAFAEDYSAGYIIGDGEAGYAEQGARWRTQQGGHEGAQRMHQLRGRVSRTAKAVWSFDDLEPRTSYDVYATWKGQRFATKKALFTVVEGSSAKASLQADQRKEPQGHADEGRTWQKIGTVTVQGDTLRVELTPRSTVGGYLLADAVKIEETGDGPASSSSSRSSSRSSSSSVISASPAGSSSSSAAAVTQCGDGVDNDGDGSTDFPADGGCSSPNDVNEADGATDIRLSFAGQDDAIQPSAGTFRTQYVAVVRNMGPDSATSYLAFQADIPQGFAVDAANTDPLCAAQGNVLVCKNFTLRRGQARVFLISYLIPPAACNSTAAVRAHVTSTPQGDPVEKQPVTVSTRIRCQVPAEKADLQLAKTYPGSAVKPGDLVEFRIEVTNKGPNVAKDVTLTNAVRWTQWDNASAASIPNLPFACEQDPVFGTVCKGFSLAPNETRTFVLKYRVSADPSACAQGITHTTTAASLTPDPNPNLLNGYAIPVNCAAAAQPRLTVAIDGPASQAFAPDQKDAVLAQIRMSAAESMHVRDMSLAIEGRITNQATLAPVDIKKAVGDVELRNVVTGQVIRGTRIYTGNTAASTYAVYDFANVPAGTSSLWQVRADLGTTLGAPANGELYRVLLCAEPKNSGTGCTFNGLTPPDLGAQLYAETLSSSALADVQPRGTIAGNSHTIATPSLQISQKYTGGNGTVTRGQNNVTLLRFEARALNKDANFYQAKFRAAQGSVLNARSYALWVDTDGDLAVDTVLERVNSQQGYTAVQFGNFPGGGFVVPKDRTVTFEVKGDIAAEPVSSVLQLRFATEDTLYVDAERLDTGASLNGIATNGACALASCQITVTTTAAAVHTITASAAGNLYVTKDATPLRNRQLLGGTVGEAILRLRFRAELADAAVTQFRLTNIGSNASSIERLELYTEGATTPFASATQSGCGAAAVPLATFCANTLAHQFTVAAGQSRTVIVRPRIKTDEQGGIRNQDIQLTVQPGMIFAETLSGQPIAANNGDNTPSGEVFVGRDFAGFDSTIVGNKNMTVMSKIVSIANASPDQNGTAVPSGVSDIGRFRFAAAPNHNSRNGLNRAMIADVIFNVTADNVQIDASSLRFFNGANPSVQHACRALNQSGQEIGGSISGSFLVQCDNMNNSALSIGIDQGTDQTFAVQANILNPRVNPASSSALQVSLQNFDSAALNGTFGVNASHISWLDAETDASAYQWIEYPETTVQGTRYGN